MNERIKLTSAKVKVEVEAELAIRVGDLILFPSGGWEEK